MGMFSRLTEAAYIQNYSEFLKKQEKQCNSTAKGTESTRHYVLFES